MNIDKIIDSTDKRLRKAMKRLAFLKWPCCIASVIFMVWCVITGLQVYHYAAAVLIIASVALMDHESGGNVIKAEESVE